jgi:hypothetical protein
MAKWPLISARLVLAGVPKSSAYSLHVFDAHKNELLV